LTLKIKAVLSPLVFLSVACILSRPCHCVETLEAALQEVASIPAYLPNCLLLKDTVDQAKEWLQETDTLQVGGS
jgi:hypothetical protein